MENREFPVVALVGCVATKLPRGSPARSLYISPLFRARRSYVEKFGYRWYILSALYSLVTPDQYLEPYDLVLEQLNSRQRREWANRVIAALDAHEGDLAGTKVEIHAGKSYRHPDIIDALSNRGAFVCVPVTERGIGSQINAYKRLMSGDEAFLDKESSVSEINISVTNFSSVKAKNGGSYGKLSDFLLSSDDRNLHLTFSTLEKVLDRNLPDSARTHKAWWANDKSGSHSQANSWMNVGWEVEHVDINQQMITFLRVR